MIHNQCWTSSRSLHCRSVGMLLSWVLVYIHVRQGHGRECEPRICESQRNTTRSHPMTRLRLLLPCCLIAAAGSGLRDTAHATNDLSVYADGLGTAWENWSWAAVDFASTAVVHSGATA